MEVSESPNKLELQVDGVRDVWVAWSNTNLTDGSGYTYPLYVTLCQETAIRLGVKGHVQGSPCPVTKVQAFLIKGVWYGPVRLLYASKEDTHLQEAREAKERVLERAKAAGLSDEDIALLRKGV